MSVAAPPNILVIMADQWAAHALGCAGSTVVRTPNLDKLANAGTRFDRAYTTFPLCVPARASLISGRQPHELGVYGNEGNADNAPGREKDSLGHWFAAAGYDCAYGGKWHAPEASAHQEDGFDVIHPFGDKGLAAAATGWLETRQNREAPFLLFVSFDNPHTICEYARDQHLPYGDVQPPADIRDAPPLPANFATAPYSPQALAHERSAAEHVYGTSGFGPDDWRLYRHAYAQLIERTDQQIGIILTAMEQQGLADNTVVLFTSDHGDGDAAHGWNQKTSLQEESIRVPFLMKGPGVPRNHVSSQLVSVGLDLIPTLCGVAGVQNRPDAKGLNCLAAQRAADEGLVVETAFLTTQHPSTLGRCFVGHRYKYTVYSWGKHREQLVDLVADPGELRNLAAESAFDAILEEFRMKLLDSCLKTNDTAFLKKLVLPPATESSVRDEIFAVPY
ncbi:sulfatase [Kribbella sp. NPDC051586]|uniref:sulfatase n=1 Tax=Kribbella sp. NPDC051586 TaxID=3364118 RepID=UPI0037998C94